MFVEIGAEVLGRQFRVGFEGDRPLDDVLKFADIARVLIVEEKLKRFGGDIGNSSCSVPLRISSRKCMASRGTSSLLSLKEGSLIWMTLRR